MRALLSLLALAFSAVVGLAQEPAQQPAQQPAQGQGAAAPPSPCDVAKKGPILDLLKDWKTSCNHPLCGQIHIADPSRLKPVHAACAEKGWLSFKDAVRDTVVGGGVVLYGEIHDNPQHHEFRSRLGLGNYAASVFEQVSVDRSAALADFVKQYGKNFTDASLAKFKEAVGWDTSGWQQYKYDELLLSTLRAQKPIYAGDASRETIKTVATTGASAIGADEQKRLKLDVALGEKQDADILDGLYEAHCKSMPRDQLANMATAQRYRDAILADNALNAATKHGSAVLFAGNEHVRKDRGVPWYVHQREPDRKVLSILLVEVEDGKTDADAYVPKDPDGKPAADYVVFTPKAAHEDQCAKMKAQ